jgi:hypothetical protein
VVHRSEPMTASARKSTELTDEAVLAIASRVQQEYAEEKKAEDAVAVDAEAEKKEQARLLVIRLRRWVM